MNIGERIYQLRKAKGYSQEELADRLGVTRQAVSKWELGTSTPELESVVALAVLFGVSTDYLLTGAEQTRSAPAEKPKQDWLDRMPGFLGNLFRRFGWLVGVYLSIVGCVLTGIGAMMRFAVQRMFGFTSFGDPYLDMQFSGFTEQFVKNNPIFAIGGVVMVIGILLIIGGIVLAVILKRKSKQ